VNGFAVSTVQTPCDLNRFGGIHTDAMTFFGNIVKFTIANDKVTACDTIYKRFRAGYPQINLQGTKIVFVRKNVAEANQAGNNKAYITVMDINGANEHDIDSFSYSASGGEDASQIDWPAGDYIYYLKPLCWDWWGPPQTTCSEIWKVKSDGSSRTRIGAYDKAYTWSMSLDGTKAGVTTILKGAGGNNLEFNCLPHAFPPSAQPTKGSWAYDVWHGCGSYLSPSGKYHQHFNGGDHGSWTINTINFPNQLVATVVVNSTDFPAWRTDMTVSTENVGAGPDMNWARWAVNSDKWICGGTKLTNTQVIPPVTVGHAQVLVDWIAHKAIVTTRNNWQATANPTACTMRSNCPGDMWIAGGPASGNAYEGVDGNWYDAISHALVQQGTVATFSRSGGNSLKNAFLASSGIIYNFKGERLSAGHISACAQNTTGHYRLGAYVVAEPGAAAKVMILNNEIR
jgi:hypothetical protein